LLSQSYCGLISPFGSGVNAGVANTVGGFDTVLSDKINFVTGSTAADSHVKLNLGSTYT